MFKVVGSVGLLCFLVFSSLVCSGCQEAKNDLGSGYEHYIAGMQAAGNGDTATAISELSLAIEAEPDVWAHVERARIYAELGEDEKASADLTAAAQFDSENTHIDWIKGELKKPKDGRFKGRFAQPPQGGK